MDGRLEAGSSALGGTTPASFGPDVQDPREWARVPAWMSQDPLIQMIMGVGPQGGNMSTNSWESCLTPIGDARG